MAKAGDAYTVVLKKSHIEWGTHRYTGSRGDVCGEGYLPIPRDVAVRLNIVNSNGTNGQDVLGRNLFRCNSSDGFFSGYLRAQGCNSAGDIYAKQFAGDKELKALGSWYARVDAVEGTRVKVEWVSETEVLLSAHSVNVGHEHTNSAIPPSHVAVANQRNAAECGNTPEKATVSLRIGDAIQHKAWGDGKIIDINGSVFTVVFSIGEKRFSNPGSFATGLIKKL